MYRRKVKDKVCVRCEEYRLLLFNGNEWEKIYSYETLKEGRFRRKILINILY